MEELCTLASSGDNRINIGIVAVLLLSAGTLFFMRKKMNISKFITVFFMLTIAFSASSAPVVFAAENNCPPSGSTEQNTTPPPSGETEEQLVDDMYETSEDDIVFDPGNNPTRVYARFNIISNDLATESDPIDPASIRFINENIINQPGEPDSTYAEIPNPSDPANNIGNWRLELDCTSDCTIDSATTGYAIIELYAPADAGQYTILYEARTMNGNLIAPALITVTLHQSLEEPSPALIDAGTSTTMLSCYTWSPESVIDLMNQITNSGPGTLDPTTIDLDPYTPGAQSTFVVTVSETNYTTISVDSAGIVTLHSPQEGTALNNYGSALFEFTITDNLGNRSSIGVVELRSACA
jgi:hypothetical protein